MNVIETIRSEINRRKELHDSNAFKTESDMIANLEIGAAQALDDLLPFLDTIDGEYIRKDAILEWAKDEQAKCSSETHPYAMFMNVVIDKLNSM